MTSPNTTQIDRRRRKMMKSVVETGRFTLSLHYGFKPAHHYDLFIEEVNHLITYGLSTMSGAKIRASRKKNHRKLYLNYEGAIKSRGFVSIVLTGEYTRNKAGYRLVGLGNLDTKRSVLRIRLK